MFCTQCGNKLNENGICERCSSSNNNVKNVKVIVSRASSVYGVAVNYKVFVDGTEVGSLSNGKSIELEIPAGVHSFAFDMWSASSAHQVTIPDNCSTFYIDTKLSMGLIKNNIKIVSTHAE